MCLKFMHRRKPTVCPASFKVKPWVSDDEIHDSLRKKIWPQKFNLMWKHPQKEQIYLC